MVESVRRLFFAALAVLFVRLDSTLLLPSQSFRTVIVIISCNNYSPMRLPLQYFSAALTVLFDRLDSPFLLPLQFLYGFTKEVSIAQTGTYGVGVLDHCGIVLIIHRLDLFLNVVQVGHCYADFLTSYEVGEG